MASKLQMQDVSFFPLNKSMDIETHMSVDKSDAAPEAPFEAKAFAASAAAVDQKSWEVDELGRGGSFRVPRSKSAWIHEDMLESGSVLHCRAVLEELGFFSPEKDNPLFWPAVTGRTSLVDRNWLGASPVGVSLRVRFLAYPIE